MYVCMYNIMKINFKILRMHTGIYYNYIPYNLSLDYQWQQNYVVGNVNRVLHVMNCKMY